MSRLWDKGTPLDERVLRYTAGDDHALDNRLVAYDVRASIAHAEMLNAQGLLSAVDLDAIRRGLTDIATEHARELVSALGTLSGKVPHALIEGALRPVLEPLQRLLENDEEPAENG